MCSRHLPAKPATDGPASELYNTLSPAGVCQKLRFSLGPDFVCIRPVSSSGNLQHVLCSSAVEFGSSQLHRARDFQPGMFGMSATASV
jgi:hypothetical protein